MKNIIILSLVLGATSFGVANENIKGDAKAGETKSAVCTACHGVGGTGVNPDWPRLAGQGEKYIFKQLTDFKSGARKDPVMAGQVAALSEQDMADLAVYFSQQKPKYDIAMMPKDAEVAESLLKHGEQLYRGGDLERSITACTACHGPAGRGVSPSAYPALSGQYAKYVTKQLKDFNLGANIHNQASTVNVAALTYRDNDNGRMMRDNAGKLTDKDIEALANVIQGLQP